MATVTRMESHPTEIMSPTIDGGYVEHTIEEAHSWRCDGCGRVWEKRWHAEKCEERSHRDSFEQGPYGVQYVENGKPVGNLRWYTRRCLYRDRVESVAR